MEHYDLSIVIVNYNVRHFLVQCLQSIRNANTTTLKIEIWVVDNASVDGSVALLGEDFPEVKVVANQANVGFSAANNQAIQSSNATYILLLNPDTVIEEDTLIRCYDFMEENVHAGAVGVKMIDGTGKFLPESKRKIPTLWNSFCKLSYLSDLFPTSRWLSGYNLGYLPDSKTHEIEVLCGAFMFIRSCVLDEVGLLDEDFFMYGEDIDLSYRILQSGAKIYYYPETSIIHYKGESTKKSSLNYVKTFYGAMHIYVKKHYDQGNAAMFMRVVNLAITIRAMMSMLGRVVGGWVRPTLDGLIVWASLVCAKNGWAYYYFGDMDYYSGTNIDTMLAVYAFIWIFVMWLGGVYDSITSWTHRIYSVATGTAIILFGYALLPEEWRSSRALILIGSLEVFILSLLTSTVVSFFTGSNKTMSKVRNIALVGSKSNCEKLHHSLQLHHRHGENVYMISKDARDNDPWFTNNMQNLPKVVSALQIDEVIYCFEDSTMKEIIQSMTSMESKVSFKIRGENALNIIGSDSRNEQSGLYHLNDHYRLSHVSAIRQKRLSDLILCILFIPLSPILFLVSGCKLQVFKNIFFVGIGRYSWVGYGGVIADYSFLPVLPKAVIPFPLASKVVDYRDDFFKRLNIAYAKDYSVLSDLKLIWNNIFKCGNV
ncbi:MAG: glycosyltransferase [Saprospiraceae bacterium]